MGNATVSHYMNAATDAANQLKPPGKRKLPPMLNKDGSVSMEGCIANLLQVLGIDVPEASNDAQWKAQLAHVCMNKIRELTGGGGSGGVARHGKPTNPLMPTDSKAVEITPNFMGSLANEDMLRAQAINAAFAAATTPPTISEAEADRIADQLTRAGNYTAYPPGTSGGRRT
jgi:hypothetical protein